MFDNDNTYNGGYVLLAFVVFIITALLCSGMFMEKKVITGHVSTMTWNRTIYELEDYQTYDCWTERNNDNRLVEKCGWKTHTRTTATWPRSGEYPEPPKWLEHRPVVFGRYTRTSEAYCLNFITENDGTYQNCTNLAHYSSYKPGDKVQLHLNYFNSILSYEKEN